jgi:hypothetical protein
MGTRGSFPEGKAAGGVKLTTHLHLVPRSKNEWSYTSTPQYALMAWFSVKAQGQLYLYLFFDSGAESFLRSWQLLSWSKKFTAFHGTVSFNVTFARYHSSMYPEISPSVSQL